jgi:2-succinyl-5-enolpyruvyl-6-hydroxy-3-cyclohexene-1-carboxylate synthase
MYVVNEYTKNLIDCLKRKKINLIVHTRRCRNSFLVQEAKERGLECVEIEDARTAAYIATGMCAETQEPVVVCSKGDNESRSMAPGLTEAYYRGLPIVAITVSDENSIENKSDLNDTVIRSSSISASTMREVALAAIQDCIKTSCSDRMPVHIDLSLEEQTEKQQNVIKGNNQQNCIENSTLITVLSKELKEDCYLFVSNYVNVDKEQFACKMVSNSKHSGLDGSVSTPLGASLAGLKKKYAVLITMKELLHDINILGNRHIPPNFVLFVMIEQDDNRKIACDYCASLGFSVTVASKPYEQLSFLIADNGRPALCVIEG